MRATHEAGNKLMFIGNGGSAGIASQLRPNTAVVFVESPGSLTFEVQDLPAIAKAARAAGAKVLIDNTWASSLYCKPLSLGADVSIQAGTKYVVGHSDANLGLVTATKEAWPAVRDLARRMGLAAGPDDVYLAQRDARKNGVGIVIDRFRSISFTIVIF